MQFDKRLMKLMVERAGEDGIDVGLLFYQIYAKISSNDGRPTVNRPLTPDERESCVCYAGAKGDLWIYECEHEGTFNLVQFRTWVQFMCRFGSAARVIAAKGLSEDDVIAVMRSADLLSNDKAA